MHRDGRRAGRRVYNVFGWLAFGGGLKKGFGKNNFINSMKTKHHKLSNKKKDKAKQKKLDALSENKFVTNPCEMPGGESEPAQRGVG